MKRSYIASGILFSALSLLLAGCGKAASGANAHKAGGTVVVAEAPDSAPDWFFPVLSASGYASYNAQIIFLMYRPLIYLNAKNQVDYSKSLVKHIGVNASGTIYTLKLSHKYDWSNGRPLTAQDVIFTWDIIKDAASLELHGPTGQPAAVACPQIGRVSPPMERTQWSLH